MDAKEIAEIVQNEQGKAKEMIQSIIHNLPPKFKAKREEIEAFLTDPDGSVLREIGFEVWYSLEEHEYPTSFLLDRLGYVAKEPWQIQLLLGDWWEMEFCKLVSDWGIYTHRFQKWKSHARARLGLGFWRIKKSISLPDILIKGNKQLALCDIKNTFPTRHDTYSIDRDEWGDRRVLLRCQPQLPQFYIIHNHRGKKWQTWGGNWIGVRLEEDMSFLEGKKKLYIQKEFIPLEELLDGFIEPQKGYRKMPFR